MLIGGVWEIIILPWWIFMAQRKEYQKRNYGQKFNRSVTRGIHLRILLYLQVKPQNT